MKIRLTKIRAAFALGLLASAMGTVAQALPDGVTTRDVKFYSEAVQCHGTLFLPNGYSDASKAAAVVLAPGRGETAAAIEKYAARFAARGMVAMTIDYRGWGKSGGFLYLGEPIQWDDRMRFTQVSTKVRLRRLRLDLRSQVIDIRNAMTYLQGEPGVDRTRLGVWGADLAGGHAITVAGSDARVKAVVAQAPLIAGKDTPRAAFAPSSEQQALMVKLARAEAPATHAAGLKMNDDESAIALAEYRPFHHLDVIAPTTAVLFVVAEKDAKIDNEANAIAAAKVLKGPTEVKSIPGTGHAFEGKASETAGEAAAEWFRKNL